MRFRAFFLYPLKKSLIGIVLSPFGPSRDNSASNTKNRGARSPIGLDVPRFPPTVAAVLICGEPNLIIVSRKGEKNSRHNSSNLDSVTQAPISNDEVLVLIVDISLILFRNNIFCSLKLESSASRFQSVPPDKTV